MALRMTYLNLFLATLKRLLSFRACIKMMIILVWKFRD